MNHDDVYEPPFLGLVRRHEEVTLHRALDILQLPVAVLGIDAGHLLPLAKKLLGVDLDVGRLTLNTLNEGLVDEDLGVWQRHTHPRVSAGEQDRSPARGHPGAE